MSTLRALALLLSACQDIGHPTGRMNLTTAQTAVPGPAANLVFTKLGEGQAQDEKVAAEIYMMNADGSGQRRITTNSHFEMGAVLSPDARTIAFHQNHDDQCCTIKLVDSDGRNERELTRGRWPSWSPDGQRIAFNAPGAGNVGDIWIINVDGTGLANLTQSEWKESRPDWSPSGDRIAFGSSRSGNTDIWTMGADGSDPVQVTDHPAVDHAPDWSPDGRKLVFQSNRDDARFDIYTVDADGSGISRLTFGGGRDLDPAWSLDGKQIAFDSDRHAIAEQIRQVYVMNADGTDQRPITAGPSENGHAGWGRTGSDPAEVPASFGGPVTPMLHRLPEPRWGGR